MTLAPLRRLATLVITSALALGAQAAPTPWPAGHRPIVDRAGVIRWADTREELRLFGANYAITSSGDFRAAGAVGADRKRVIDQDLAHFARMGWDGMRLAFWGDWQSADREGNLLATPHLDLLDYLIAKARARGIALLFNPIHTYHAGWPDALRDSFPGFAAHVPRERLGTDPAAIAAQQRYIRQLMAHVNPYTGTALKDEPAIVFVEMINEPVHHPDDTVAAVRYIDGLVDAVRSSGSRAITVHNLTQDVRIAEAIRRSTVQAASYGWYPTGLNSGRELRGNTLRAVDDYPAFRIPGLVGRPRLVYEFDSADQLTGTMYPAMVRAFRQGGVQLAAMFAYDMLATASRNLGWQTHRLNLVYTPRKAMSAVIAAEAMRRLPRGGPVRPYPENLRFGPVRVSHEENLAELVTADAFLHAGTTRTVPPSPATLRRLAGYGSSPLVTYEGEGTWFLDQVRDGVWRLEVYPDAVDVDDPFHMPRVDKLVTRVLHRDRAMVIRLPDLGGAYVAQPIARGTAGPVTAVDGRVVVRPGVYVLSARGPVDRATLPTHVGMVRFDEYVVAEPDSLDARVRVTALPQVVSGDSLRVTARVIDDAEPDEVRLWLRPVGRSWFSAHPMRRRAAYDWHAAVSTDSLRLGPHEYVVTVRSGGRTTTWPDRIARAPSDWDFHVDDRWTTTVVAPRTPLPLLDPARDAGQLSFTRVGDAGRAGLFRVVPSAVTGGAALHLELPAVPGADQPDDYTASLVIDERVAGRGATLDAATGVRVRLRGVSAGQQLHLTLMERDGTSWTTTIACDETWRDVTIPISSLTAGRGVKLPLGFPGRWNYWVEPAAGRGSAGDRLRPSELDRLQLSVRPIAGIAIRPGAIGVEVETVTIVFE